MKQCDAYFASSVFDLSWRCFEVKNEDTAVLDGRERVIAFLCGGRQWQENHRQRSDER